MPFNTPPFWRETDDVTVALLVYRDRYRCYYGCHFFFSQLISHWCHSDAFHLRNKRILNVRFMRICYCCQVVRRFARHFQTHEPMPEDMLQRLCASKYLFGASEMQLQVSLDININRKNIYYLPKCCRFMVVKRECSFNDIMKFVVS